MVNYEENSNKGIETLPVCCLITDEDKNIWCKKIILIKSHIGFRHEIKFCTDPYDGCPHMSTADLHFQEKDRVKNRLKKDKTK